jgi:hypothetical protein
VVGVRLRTGWRPVRTEHAWARALSPCHGELLAATVHDGAVDYGDTVLWHRRPVGRVRAGEREVALLVGLGRVAHGGWRTHRFAARASDARAIETLPLPQSGFVYVHDAAPADGGVLVRGKVVLPEACDANTAWASIEAAVDVAFASPSLHEARGDDARAHADVERLRTWGVAPEEGVDPELPSA